MEIYDDLRRAPFDLDQYEVSRVWSIVDDLSLEDRAAQIFVLLLLGEREEDFDVIRRVKPGGFTRFFGTDLDLEMKRMRSMFDALPVPPLVTADMEGSRQSFAFGTQVPNQLALSAADDTGLTRACAGIMAREGRQLGIAWSFTPVIDISAAFRSAIVGSRSFGSDIDRIERHALAHIEGLQTAGVAATAKHWPGEGFDDRDQHLVTTINPQSMEEWHATFGRLYRRMFDAGVMSVMSAHIALPAYMRALNPKIGVNAFKPASVNYDLTTRLLRKELGFNGIVVSDATEMAGLGSWISRKDAPVEVLKAGCDVILFSQDPEADIAAIVTAVKTGAVSAERLEEAVARVVALKLKMGLLDGQVDPSKKLTLAAADDVATANRAIARGPTLVKDVAGILPIDPRLTPRVLVVDNGIRHPLLAEEPDFDLPGMLAAEGFDVTRFDPETAEGPTYDPGKFDLVVYLLGDESLLTKSRIFIDWRQMMGGLGRALDRPWPDIPTIMVSFGHPYHLYDAPRVPCYINAYCTLPEMQRAVVDCLLGKAKFHGTNPVDPFCGLEDAHY